MDALRRPQLQTSGIEAVQASEASSTSSPARRENFSSVVLARLGENAPLFMKWKLWRYHPTRDPTEPDLKPLESIQSIAQFWSTFNHFPIMNIYHHSNYAAIVSAKGNAAEKPEHLGKEVPMTKGDVLYLFHDTVKPQWEDERNQKGGKFTFKVHETDKARWFWFELIQLAVRNVLQEAVADPGRTKFHDDICGVGVKKAMVGYDFEIWTRDGDHHAGQAKLFEVIMRSEDTVDEKDGKKMPTIPNAIKPERAPQANVKPEEEFVKYYRKHSSHRHYGVSSQS